MKSGLKFLTLNCWGLPLITPFKNKRLDAITEIIKQGQWDVVALQEVWLKRDQERLIRNSGYPYSIVFKGGSRLFGSGMLLLSRFKILAHDFHKFVVMGFPHRIHEGDYHATKGVGYALLDTPIGKLPVFSTHLIAKYSRRHENDINRVFRIAQILELVFYIRRKTTPSGFVLCGDLNATENDLELETLFALTGVNRAWRPRLRTFKKRLDHIVCGATHNELTFRTAGSRLAFRQPFRVSESSVPYSDHEGVSAFVRPANVKIEQAPPKRVVERTLRYMSYTLLSVKELDAWIRCVPLIGPLSSFFMRPQFTYIEALLNMLETDLKLAQSQHPLRLKEII